jgi:DNA-binding transcriptional ArsR family regulator
MDSLHEAWLAEAAQAPDALFRAMADPIRRRLLQALVGGPLGAGELSRRLGVPRVNVSHHLGVLAAAGLVEQRQRVAQVKPQALTRLRRYFDLALTTAAINRPERVLRT